MKPRLAIILTLFRAELRMLLRDSRIILVSIILPLAVTPALLLISSWSNEHRARQLEHMVYYYSVTGPRAAEVRAIVEAARQRAQQAPDGKGTNAFHYEERASTNSLESLNEGSLQLVLEGLDPGAAGTNSAATGTNAAVALNPAAAAPSSAGTNSPEATSPGASDLPVIRMVFRADREESSGAMSRMHDLLENLRQARRAASLQQHGFPVAPGAVAVVTPQDAASEGHVAGLALGRFLTAFVMLFLLAGCAVVATDSVVGEKERGTLETLLTTAATRTEIVAAKHLLVLGVGLLITLIQAGNLLLYVGLHWIPVKANMAAAVPPGVGLLLFVLLMPLAAVTASVLLLTSSYAKSYKEAQLYFSPVFLLMLLPALASVLPELPLRSAILLVPVANIAVGVKEVLIGTFDWPMLAVSWGLTWALAAWLTRVSIRSLSAERLIAATETDAVQYMGGAALFERQVLLWFGLLWAVLLIISNYMGELDVRIQATVNLAGLFLVATAAMLWRFRLDPRKALALRAPRAAIWPAIFIAAPGGLLTGEGLARFVDLFLPTPSKVSEAFNEAVLPGGVPMWELFFFIALLPAVFEEITFRGMLLHGLHRKLHPAALILVVGTVFGLFHVMLFRIVPTAVLGMLLAAVVVETGSIYPAMLWHALNNGLSLLAARNRVPVEHLAPAYYLVGAVLLACAYWIIWRNRTPYPGLRPWRRASSGSSGSS